MAEKDDEDDQGSAYDDEWVTESTGRLLAMLFAALVALVGFCFAVLRYCYEAFFPDPDEEPPATSKRVPKK